MVQRALSNDANIDGLLWDGWRWDSNTITYSFPATAAAYPTVADGFNALNPAQQAAAVIAFNQIANFASITFTPVAANGNINLAEATKADLNNDGVVNAQDDANNINNTAIGLAPSQEHIDGGIAGDIWFRTASYRAPNIGSYQFASGIIHEIGHALGLKHPHLTEGANTQLLPSDRDALAYTIMSYRDYPGDPVANGGTEGIGSGNNSPQSYMMLDIQALQYLYGANFTVNAGATTYKFTPNLIGGTNFFVNGADSEPGLDLAANVIFRTIWDAGGIDTYDFSSYSNGLIINLTPGEWSNVGDAQLARLEDGQRPPGSIANALQFNGDSRSLIENAIGGSGSDEMTGNAADNTLTGNGGSDALNGGGGLDRLIGGQGDDRYRLFDVALIVRGPVLGKAYDTVVEGLNGGIDTVVVRSVRDPTTALLTYTSSYTLGANIENGEVNTAPFQPVRNFSLTGNALDNHLTGNNAANTLQGLGGNDTLQGRLGVDTLDGGVGTDTASYAIGGSANVFLAAQNLNNGAAAGDTLISIENLIGSRFGDILSGDGNANVLEGGAGNDFISGGGGADILRGGNGDDVLGSGTGADRMEGGANIDTASYELFGTGVTANLGNAAANSGVALGDTYVSIENLRGSGGNDILTGDDNANTIEGANGGDNLTGGGGDDRLYGGDGGDVLYGGLGADWLEGGAGNDAYVIDQLIDTVVEASTLATEIDTVFATVSGYTLAANVENLNLGGFAAIDGNGNSGMNVITGNSAANVINGRSANDTLTGGLGADTFVFNTSIVSASNIDAITDFAAAVDTIRLENTGRGVFGTLTALGELSAALFTANATGVATDADDRVVYNTTNGALFYDANGNAAGGAFQFATLTNHAAITAADFVVI